MIILKLIVTIALQKKPHCLSTISQVYTKNGLVAQFKQRAWWTPPEGTSWSDVNDKVEPLASRSVQAVLWCSCSRRAAHGWTPRYSQVQGRLKLDPPWWASLNKSLVVQYFAPVGFRSNFHCNLNADLSHFGQVGVQPWNDLQSTSFENSSGAGKNWPPANNNVFLSNEVGKSLCSGEEHGVGDVVDAGADHC